MDANDLIELAKKLIENNPNEAAIRTSISRTYYFAYHETISFFGQILNIETDRNSRWHTYLPDLLIHSDDQNLKVFGSFLLEAKQKRTNADYFIKKPIRKEEASYIIKACLENIDKLWKLHINQTNVQTKIKEYIKHTPKIEIIPNSGSKIFLKIKKL